MADLENSTQLAKEALDELRKAGSLSAKTLDKLSAAVKQQTKDTDKSIEAIDDEVKAREKLTKDLMGLAKSIGSAAQSVRENREDFRSLGPAVDATAQGLKMSMGGVAKGMDALGGVLSGVGAVLPGWGKLVGVFGGAISGASRAVQKYGADAVDAAAQYAKFSLGEIQRVVGAFQTLGDVGGITGESFRGLMKDAQSLGLSVDTYAKLIARNSEGLAAVTGTVTGGADVLKKITTAGTEFEDKFLKLGFSFEQQSEFSARFLAQQRNLVRINLEDGKALSEANRNYLTQIDELARLTGMSKDKVAGEVEAMSRELRFGATLAIAEQKKTADAIRKAASVLEKQGSKEIAEGFKDIFGGATTERSQGLMAATGGAAAQLADDLENGRINFTEFMAKFQQSVRETRQALGADEFERRVGKLGTVLDPMLVGMRRLDKAQDLNAETLGKATKDQKDASENKDKETQDIIDAQKSLRDFAVTIDKIVSDKLFPTMATSVKYFTDVISDGAEKIAKILGVDVAKPQAPKTPPVGGNAPGSRAGGETPATTPTGDLKSKIMQLESGGRNIGTGLGGGTSSAFGLYQMTRTTFNALARQAKEGDPLYGKRFEEMREDTNLQSAAMDALLAANQAQLSKAKVSTKDAAMYMSHVLGAGTATKILQAADSTRIDDVVLPIAKANNPKLFEGVSTVGDIKASFDRVTGGGGYQYGGISSGPKSGYMSMLHGTEAVIPLPGGRSVPVEMTGMSDRMGEQVSLMTEQVNRFDQMISLLQSSVDMQGKIYRATAN